MMPARHSRQMKDMGARSMVPHYYDDPAMDRRVRSLRVARARRARRRRRQLLLRRLLFALALLLVLGAVTAVLVSAFRRGAGAGAALSGPDALPAADALDAAAPAAPQGIVVYIDPGHGGIDAGAEGLGFDEAEMTWQTAQDVMALLEADDRFSPFLTKALDDTYKPSERAAIAKKGGAQLVLSIHGNADPVYDSRGYECYPAPPGRANHEDSMRFARLLAQGFADAGEPLRGEDGVRFLYYDENDEKRVYESYDTTVRDWPSFTLLEDAGCAAVLSEQCFITNAEDAAALAGERGCQAAARIYYAAICAYFDLTPKSA